MVWILDESNTPTTLDYNVASDSSKPDCDAAPSPRRLLKEAGST